jgi:hypothetical protein
MSYGQSGPWGPNAANEPSGAGRDEGPRELMRGIRRRVAATLGLVLAATVAIVVYLAFFAIQYAWYQSVAVILLVVVITPVVIIAMWVSFAMSQAGRRIDRAGRGRHRGGMWSGPEGAGFWGAWADAAGTSPPRDPEGVAREIESYVSYLEDIAPGERAQVGALAGRFRESARRLDRLAEVGPTAEPGAPRPSGAAASSSSNT